MARRIFCRWCQSEEQAVAGEMPPVCATCGNIGRWSTEKHTALLERRQHGRKRPRVPFDVTDQDYRLFLRRIKISAD